MAHGNVLIIRSLEIAVIGQVGIRPVKGILEYIQNEPLMSPFTFFPSSF